MKISKYRTMKLVTAEPRMPVKEAFALMRRYAVKLLRDRRYGALPVLNKKEEPAGILSAYDLLSALEEKLGGSGELSSES